MVELVNWLTLLSLPIVFWRLRKRRILWLKTTVLFLFIANIILNQATTTALRAHHTSEFNQFFWLAFSCRLVILLLAGYGILISFPPTVGAPNDIAQKPKYSLTYKQKVVLAFALSFLSLDILAAYSSALIDDAKHDVRLPAWGLFVNTAIGVIERIESPLGITCLIVLSGCFYRFRTPRDRGIAEDGYELLSHATRLEVDGRVNEALAAYRDIANRYAHTDAGRDAQKSLLALESKRI